ncbi:uncharacterized protein TNCV_3724321 [Trichonephila clavipes]|nr:uncharacterized protein TNCV_3724321 [Trichonephila clavipes]
MRSRQDANSNESLHSCIWRKCPRGYSSQRRLEIAVTDAIEKHNLGYVKSLEKRKEDSCLNDSFSLTIAERQDKRRISQNISTKQKGKEMPRIQMRPYGAGAFKFFIRLSKQFLVMCN